MSGDAPALLKEYPVLARLARLWSDGLRESLPFSRWLRATGKRSGIRVGENPDARAE
jgi:hypothetical protein